MKNLYSDDEIVKGLREHDDSVINYIYDKYYILVMKYITYNSGRSLEADDVLQEALIKLYTEVRKTDFSLNCTFDTYFSSIYKNTWKRNFRNKNKLVFLDVVPDIIDEIITDSFNDRKKSLLQQIAIEQFKLLKPDCQKTLELFYIEKVNMDEIASEFSFKNKQIAKNKRYRCLMYLKALVQKHKFYKKVFDDE
jgi:RNA polymerase sigma factor (sigma-70 family)